MNLIVGALDYLYSHQSEFGDAIVTHLELSGFSLLLGLIISIPFGILCARNAKLSHLIMSVVNTFRVIPSLAILIIVMPLLGTGFTPALIALTVLACPPILINTFLGVKSVDREVLESAKGMGMSSKQILMKIEISIALPLILSGIRTGSVEIISSATLAAFIGGGGLGTFIISGLSMYNFSMLLVGAIPVALLAIFSELLFGSVESVFTKYKRV